MDDVQAAFLDAAAVDVPDDRNAVAHDRRYAAARFSEAAHRNLSAPPSAGPRGRPLPSTPLRLGRRSEPRVR
jgi:hypothetical protein